MKKRMLTMLALLTAASVGLAACGGSKEKAGQDSNPQEQKEDVKPDTYTGGPAELLVLNVNAGVYQEQFEKWFVEPIQKKYPQIKLTLAGEALDKLLAAGTPPDLLLVSNAGLVNILENDIPEDLTQMVKQYGIDLSAMDAAVVQQTQKLGDNKAFYGVPFAMNYGAMVYNQDIFDKFGVAYPKEPMTYEQTLELAKKLTRNDGGVSYIGVMPPDLRQLYWQYGVPVFDQATQRAKLTTDQHAKVFNLLKEFYSIPGYIQNGKHTHSTDVFFKEQRMAMYPNWVAAISSFFTNAGTKDAFKWDLTAHPGFSDRKGLGKEVDYHMIVVNKSSKNLEAAHYVVKEMVTKEVQTILSRAGRISVLTDNSIRNQYGADSDVYKGKDLQSIFKVTPSPLPPASKFDAKINSILINEAAKAVAVEGVDVNTALRNAEEKANKEVIIPELGK